MDAAVGAVVMGAVIGVLMAVGRYVSQNELLAVGAGPFTGLAALLIPIALFALVFASFLQSVGALDREDRTIYLYEPDQAIDLTVIENVSIRPIGDSAVVTLSYAQPDGQYVQGPRRLVVPPRSRIVTSQRSSTRSADRSLVVFVDLERGSPASSSGSGSVSVIASFLRRAFMMRVFSTDSTVMRTPS